MTLSLNKFGQAQLVSLKMTKKRVWKNRDSKFFYLFSTDADRQFLNEFQRQKLRVELKLEESTKTRKNFVVGVTD